MAYFTDVFRSYPFAKLLAIADDNVHPVPWVLLLLLVPVVGWFALIIINIYTKFTLAEGFGKGIGFGFGLWILGPIFEAILAFSRKSKYIGFNRK